MSGNQQSFIEQYPNAKYSFDSCAFIDTWRRWYSPDVFKTVWDFITEKIQNKVIFSTRLVKVEIERQRDEILDYVSQFSNLFINPSREEQRIVREIVNNPDFTNWSTNPITEADPFVIAFAKINDLIVVTYENPNSHIKIPAACRIFDVECINFIEFLRNESFRI